MQINKAIITTQLSNYVVISIYGADGGIRTCDMLIRDKVDILIMSRYGLTFIFYRDTIFPTDKPHKGSDKNEYKY